MDITLVNMGPITCVHIYVPMRFFRTYCAVQFRTTLRYTLVVARFPCLGNTARPQVPHIWSEQSSMFFPHEPCKQHLEPTQASVMSKAQRVLIPFANVKT